MQEYYEGNLLTEGIKISAIKSESPKNNFFKKALKKLFTIAEKIQKKEIRSFFPKIFFFKLMKTKKRFNKCNVPTERQKQDY